MQCWQVSLLSMRLMDYVIKARRSIFEKSWTAYGGMRKKERKIDMRKNSL